MKDERKWRREVDRSRQLEMSIDATLKPLEIVFVRETVIGKGVP